MKKILFIAFCLMIISMAKGQVSSVTVSGTIKDKADTKPLAYANVVIKQLPDSLFITGAVSSEDGRFSLSGIKPGNYFLEVSFVGYERLQLPIFVGKISDYLEINAIELVQQTDSLSQITVTATRDNLASTMDKKTYEVEKNVSQSGGSVLQSLQNLPGVSVQDGQVQLRGSSQVTILIDGKQTALTGFGTQSALDNIPASAIERIEIINNPSAKYDANGQAGIINIIYKKNKQEGFNGKIGISAGAGALWIKRENLPTIRPQYQATPKLNPSVSVNYKKKKVNLFFQGDYLYTHTLNKNEFVVRTYDDGTIINQQTKRNRNTGLASIKSGIDWQMSERNQLTVSGFFSSEKILDNGDEPFFNSNNTERLRLWQFLEDELKTTAMAMTHFQHKFKQPGHLLNASFNYTYHRENEKYFFDNILPDYTGHDAFKLISDEHVGDFSLDYVRPLKYGRFEGGFKYRHRFIPTNMQFFPGYKSPIDSNAGGWATYKEDIPALYSTYAVENKKWEAEIGLRVEYVKVNYLVNPDHNTYKSNGYNYTQPFPNVRLGWKINTKNKITLFYNRRVDRPNEVDIRIFPKYDDAEIVKVGNPALKPQFTSSLEAGYKKSWAKGNFYAALYHKILNGTITRIASVVPDSRIIYNIFQNVNKSYNTGMEMVFSQDINKFYTINVNGNIYRNQINAFTVQNLYPKPNTFSADQQELISGNLKLNNYFHVKKKYDIQLTALYLAPDLIPQGTIGARFSLDFGIKKSIQKGKGELYLNGTDLLNTMVIKRSIIGSDFNYISSDYYETQVFRLGYNYKF